MNINELPTIELSSRAKNLTGKRQGKLIFIKPAEKQDNGRIYWWVQCDCGNIEKIRADNKNKVSCCKCSNIAISQKNKWKSFNDLSGQKFGRLTILYPTENQMGRGMYWHCKCDCGKEIDVISQSLTSRNTQSCGCLKKEKAHFTQSKLNLVGQRFGKLLVIEETKERQYSKVVWKCQCDCGNIIYLNTTRLTQGNDISCGCQNTSYGALQIDKILKDNHFNYKKEYSNSELKGKRFDFALLNDDNEVIRLIEFDGEQHYHYTGGWNTKEQMLLTQQRDKIKNDYALAHNIPLVRIPYWERNNITLDMIIGDKYLYAY